MPELRSWLDTLAAAQPQTDGRRITHFTDRDAELAAVDAGLPGMTPLTTLGVIAVRGDAALAFLHGQLSADLRAMTSGQTVLTAWCSPKGRVVFLLRVVVTDDGFRLLLPLDQIAACVKRLRLFVLRAAVEIEDRSAAEGVLLLRGLAANASLPETLCSGGTPELCWCVGSLRDIGEAWPTFAIAPCGEDAAALDAIRRGLPVLDHSLADEFLPQELNLDYLAGVSFEKGCYPGQEIVARVRFRGTVKRRLARLSGDPGTPAASGSRVCGVGSEQAVGTVLDCVRIADESVELLAVLRVDAEAIYLAGSPGSLLRRQPLPEPSATP
ncbi:MAG: hypothetical protein WD928_00235 [Gammaproteobacteria bacterium]